MDTILWIATALHQAAVREAAFFVGLSCVLLPVAVAGGLHERVLRRRIERGDKAPRGWPFVGLWVVLQLVCLWFYVSLPQIASELQRQAEAF